MGITVEINEVPKLQYSEYFLTGFQILKEKNIIEKLKINYNQNVKPGNFQRISNKLRRELNILNKDSINHSHLLATISDGSKKKKIAINFLDTPWAFNSDYLEDVDTYFKCQYPKDFKQGYFSITSSQRIKIPEFVMDASYKVKPLMLGRPLSRTMDFSKNKKILEKYEAKRKTLPRENKVLVYFGMADDDEPVPNTHHPHLKRAMIVEWVNKNIPEAKTIFKLSRQEEFLKELSPEIKSLEDKTEITDKMYFDLVQNSISTINITGLRGSIPFRVIDSFLSGMVLISDNMNVDWYEPLVPGKDFLSLGDLGYERLEDISFEGSCKKLEYYLETIKETFMNTADYKEEKYNRYYSPEAVTKNILRETDVL